MPLGMAGGTIAAMVIMLMLSIVIALIEIGKNGPSCHNKLMWCFGTMSVEVLVIFVTMTNYINHGVGAS
jgi:hypothetical protein